MQDLEKEQQLYKLPENINSNPKLPDEGTVQETDKVSQD